MSLPPLPPLPPLPSGPLALAIALAAGIAAAPRLEAVPEVVRWAVALALVAAAGLRWRRLVLIAVVVIGAARGARPEAAPPAGAIADDRDEERIEGVIEGPVMRTARGYGARLAVGGVDIWLWSEEPLAAGERLAATGSLRTPRGSRGPAQPDREAALWVWGARLELHARAGAIERLADEPGPIARMWRWAAETQAAGAAAIERAGGEPAARAALRGLSVGDRTGIPEELDARWRAAGIYHVLSVSGLHLAVVAGLAYALLRRLAAASPWGGRARPARWAAPPALAIAVAYTLVTGAQLATLRALIVIAVVLVAAAIDRPVRLADALGFAALVLLSLRPADLLDPGFQLSFAAALALALRPEAGQRAETRSGRALAWLRRAVVTSLWVSLVTAPITAHHFHEVTAGGVVGNLALTPPIELGALPLALGGLAVGWDAPVWAATQIVSLADAGAALLALVAPVGHVAVAGAGTAAALVALTLWLAARPRGGRPLLGALAWAALCAGWALGRAPPPEGAVRVSFLDVGQGDASIIELPDGAVWLVDAGGHAGAPDAAAAAAPGRAIRRALAAAGHARIDLAIISHPHPDHYLGLAAIGLPIGEVWTAREVEPPREPARADGASAGALPGLAAILSELQARGTRLAHPPLGLARAQAGAELVVWGPRYHESPGAPPTCAADPVRSVNDNSLIIELRYRGRSILFLGDLEAEGEALLAEAGLPRADVVKVAHHGSATSSTEALVAAARPALAVISCGRANRFGFPAPAVLERWRAAGAEIARTDLDGEITVTIDATGRLEVDRFAR